jgi:mRNA interferase MazF
MTLRRGEVVLVDWPFSDTTGRKLRPAVVVQADFLNTLIADTVLVQITGTSRSAATEVPLDPAVEPRSGLQHLSYAVCNNLLTRQQTLVYRRLGELSTGAMRRIEDGIKTALALP